MVPTQHDRPYADALIRQAERPTINLMIPGHGTTPDGLSAELAAFVGDLALKMDLPTLIDGIDVGPGAPLEQAMDLAAEAWSARRTWFLTGGASQANRMATLAIASLGKADTVVAQRSAHSSFFDGLIFADLVPSFVMPTIDYERGINHGVSPARLREGFEQALAAGSHVAGAYVISPSYFGMVADVSGLAEVAHEYGVPLIVDAAWGAHFGFHEALPESPTRQGADLVISSTHKLGGSLGQSAMLHLSHGPFAEQLEPLVHRVYAMNQSTSSSALLMGSLDIARHALVHGTDEIGETLAHVERLRASLRADGRFPLISDQVAELPDVVGSDPLRVPVDVSIVGRSGHDVQEILAREFGIYLEISTAAAIVAFVGPGKLPDLETFEAALFDLADRHAARDLEPLSAEDLVRYVPPKLPAPGDVAVRPRDAYFSGHELVAAEHAAGRVSVDALAAYPPGIPNLIPGEVITEETLAFLRSVADSPVGYVRGAVNNRVTHLRVLPLDAEVATVAEA